MDTRARLDRKWSVPRKWDAKRKRKGGAQAVPEVEADGGVETLLDAEGRDGKGLEPWFAETARERFESVNEEQPAEDAG